MWFAIILLVMPHEPTASDLDLANAVEQSVAAGLSMRPPEPFRTMIDDLGNDCFAYREEASERLEKASADNLRWLFWGRKHADPEIRLRCNSILRKLTACKACDGVGFCSVYLPNDSQYTACRRCGHMSWIHAEQNALPCLLCKGLGSAWHRGAFE